MSDTPFAKQSVTALPGFGPKRAERLRLLGIETIEDLLRHAPRGYEDRGEILSIGELPKLDAGSFVVIRGTLGAPNARRFGKRATLRVRVKDATGGVTLLWFNAPYLAKSLSAGATIVAAGRVSDKGALLQPEYALVEEDEEPPARLTGIRPVYPVTDGISQRQLHDAVGVALEAADAIVEPYSQELLKLAEVCPLRDAFQFAHRPTTMAEAERGRERLLFDELLPIELAVERRSRARRERPAVSGHGGGGAPSFLAKLPFEATESQRECVDDIVHDFAGDCPMSRVVLGEVGCGKTIVALAAVAEASSRGLQSALLAPTDLLARQHFRTAVEFGAAEADRIALLTGSMPAAAAREVRRRALSGELDLVVGTHALLSEDTRFAALGLVVVDEEQRFGVDQREKLLKSEKPPHSLVLTATPIPRSLALLAFGDSEVSRLDMRPGARGEVVTRLVPSGKRAASLEWLAQQIQGDDQAFLVRPRIAGEEAGAAELFEEVKSGPLAGIPIGIVHGRTDPLEREETLTSFVKGELRALVTTTLVEVGVDVPGANILWIEGAERLGLAQLHQLRGRIARRGQSGYCWILEPEDEIEATDRLRFLVEETDGFRLAELDLAVRGPGELLGLRQSGRLGLFAGFGARGADHVESILTRTRKAAQWIVDSEASKSKEETCGSH